MGKNLFWLVLVTAPDAVYDLSDDISSLTIEQKEMTPDKLTIELSDPYKVLGHALQEGMDILVDLGTDDDHGEVFRGGICTVEGAFPESGVPTLTIHAYDSSIRMGLRKRSRGFENMKLSELVKKIADPKYYQSVKVDIDEAGDFDFGPNATRQQNETDLCFLLRLAKMSGCVMYVRPDEVPETLRFVSQQKLMMETQKRTLTYGRCGVPERLLTFNPTVDVGNIQLPRVFSGLNYADGAATEQSSSTIKDVGNQKDIFFDENLSAYRNREPIKSAQLKHLIEAAPKAQEKLRTQLGTTERVTVPTFVTPQQLAAITKNQFSTSIHGMRATGKTIGNHYLFASSAVEIADVGGRFSGTWYLSQVRHVLDREGYLTEFECRR